jgi:hypothetical protein
MNFTLILKYFGLLTTVAMALEEISAEIAAGQSASTPPISTYLEGKHGNVTLNWTPTP